MILPVMCLLGPGEIGSPFHRINYLSLLGLLGLLGCLGYLSYLSFLSYLGLLKAILYHFHEVFKSWIGR
jgi:hypothetical protein